MRQCCSAKKKSTTDRVFLAVTVALVVKMMRKWTVINGNSSSLDQCFQNEDIQYSVRNWFHHQLVSIKQ